MDLTDMSLNPLHASKTKYRFAAASQAEQLEWVAALRAASQLHPGELVASAWARAFANCAGRTHAAHQLVTLKRALVQPDVDPSLLSVSADWARAYATAREPPTLPTSSNVLVSPPRAPVSAGSSAREPASASKGSRRGFIQSIFRKRTPDATASSGTSAPSGANTPELQPVPPPHLPLDAIVLATGAASPTIGPRRADFAPRSVSSPMTASVMSGTAASSHQPAYTDTATAVAATVAALKVREPELQLPPRRLWASEATAEQTAVQQAAAKQALASATTAAQRRVVGHTCGDRVTLKQLERDVVRDVLEIQCCIHPVYLSLLCGSHGSAVISQLSEVTRYRQSSAHAMVLTLAQRVGQIIGVLNTALLVSAGSSVQPSPAASVRGGVTVDTSNGGLGSIHAALDSSMGAHQSTCSYVPAKHAGDAGDGVCTPVNGMTAKPGLQHTVPVLRALGPAHSRNTSGLSDTGSYLSSVGGTDSVTGGGGGEGGCTKLPAGGLDSSIPGGVEPAAELLWPVDTPVNVNPASTPPLLHSMLSSWAAADPKMSSAVWPYPTCDAVDSRILEFAREVMLCSSRTVTGGDGYDAVTTLLASKHILVTPHSSAAPPICVRIHVLPLPSDAATSSPSPAGSGGPVNKALSTLQESPTDHTSNDAAGFSDTEDTLSVNGLSVQSPPRCASRGSSVHARLPPAVLVVSTQCTMSYQLRCGFQADSDASSVDSPAVATEELDGLVMEDGAEWGTAQATHERYFVWGTEPLPAKVRMAIS